LPAQTTVSGNAGTATKLATARTIALTGDVTGLGSFNGSEDLTISTTIKNGVKDSTFTTFAYAGAAVAGVSTTFTASQIRSLDTILSTLMRASHTHRTVACSDTCTDCRFDSDSDK
jgi:hypothetical protein